MGKALEVTDATWKTEVLESDVPVLVDFWAPWCGPCRAMAPTVEAIAEQMDGRLKVVKLNTDENTETAGQYGIFSIPTFLIFVGGKPVAQHVGAASRGAFMKAIEDFLAQQSA